MCERCLPDRVVAATVVNHKVPLAHGGLDTDDNTENLCEPCDIIVTAEQFNRAAPVEGKGIGRDGRPTSRDHPWNRPPPR